MNYYKTFVSIGNGQQNFYRLLHAVEANIHLLPKPILIQCGHTSFKSMHAEVVQFINMDRFLETMRHAQILILHAGAGSVMNAMRAGKKPIVMPRREIFNEIVNDHQVIFAKRLHQADKVVMVENEDELAKAIQQTNEQKTDVLKEKSQALHIIRNTLSVLLN